MTIDTLPPPAAGIGRLFRRAVAWWLDELAQMVPRRLAALLAGRDGQAVVLQLGPHDRLAWSSVSALRPGRRGAAAVIGLDRSLVFERILELPLAAKATLRQILQHQIERLVPLAPSEVGFAYRPQPHGADAETFNVRVFIAKRATIERALAVARESGLYPKRIVVAEPDLADDPPLLWQAESTGGAQRRWRRRFEILALVLAAAGYSLWVHRLDRMRDGLEARLTAAAPAATAARGLAAEAEEVDAAASFFARRGNETRALAAVDALTRLVPLDSWLTRLSLRGREVEIVGYSPRPSGLVARVEASAFFANPQFRSPITLTPDGRSERFDLTFEVRPEAAR